MCDDTEGCGALGWMCDDTESYVFWGVDVR